MLHAVKFLQLLFVLMFQGSEKLIQLVTDCSEIQNSGNGDTDGTESKSKFGTHDLAGPPWVNVFTFTNLHYCNRECNDV